MHPHEESCIAAFRVTICAGSTEGIRTQDLYAPLHTQQGKVKKSDTTHSVCGLAHMFTEHCVCSNNVQFCVSLKEKNKKEREIIQISQHPGLLKVKKIKSSLSPGNKNTKIKKDENYVPLHKCADPCVSAWLIQLWDRDESILRK